MEKFIGCDAHKLFSVFVSVNEKGKAGEVVRVPHERQLYREFLARLPAHSTIAVEASGHYSWLVDEMESRNALQRRSYRCETGGSGLHPHSAADF